MTRARNDACPCGSGKKFKKCCASPAGVAESINSFNAQKFKDMVHSASAMCVKYPGSALAWKLLGVALLSSGQDGLSQLLKSHELDNTDADVLNNLGNAYRGTGDNVLAEKYYCRAIRLQPRFPEPHFNLGGLYLAQERFALADQSYRRAIALQPAYADAHNNRGLALKGLGRTVEAELAWHDTIRIRGASAEAYYNLANSLILRGDTMRAIEYFKVALKYRPTYAEAANNLGSAYQGINDHESAIGYFRSAVFSNPLLPEAHNNLGLSLQRIDRLSEAEQCLKRALELNPSGHDTYSGLGSVYLTMGRLTEAAGMFRQALTLKPDFSGAQSNLIFTLDMMLDTGEAYRERTRWNDRVNRTGNEYVPHAHTARRIKIGYVSGDFRAHSAVSAFGAMLLDYDREQFDVFCYSNWTGAADGLTELLTGAVDHWYDISHMNDVAATKLIRDCTIDILVDLSGHTAGNRLGIFARRAAPVQITAWGYATGTGLTEMDVFFADPVLVPAAERDRITERVIDLPCVATAYFSEPFPAIVDHEHEGIVFGSLNRVTKISDECYAAWCEILRSVPNSRMILKAPELSDPMLAARVREKFGDMADRVELRGRTTWFEHVKTYNEIDVVLDPFPHGGGVTTMESLIMGVPMVTLRWPTVVGRVSASILSAVGIGEWVADGVLEYISRAILLSSQYYDRSRIRDKFYASPVGDRAAYVQAVEAAYVKLIGDETNE